MSNYKSLSNSNPNSNKSKIELEIITDDNINLSLLNSYELYFYNYYKSGKITNENDFYLIIENKNCSIYFATYVLSTIQKLDIGELYRLLSRSRNLTIQDIKKIPINIVNEYNVMCFISHYANLYYCDII